MQKEPALTVATVTAFVSAIIGLLVAFNIDITENQRDAILTVIGAAFPIIILVGGVIRQFVWSPNSVEDIRDAYRTSDDSTYISH